MNNTMEFFVYVATAVAVVLLTACTVAVIKGARNESSQSNGTVNSTVGLLMMASMFALGIVVGALLSVASSISR